MPRAFAAATFRLGGFLLNGEQQSRAHSRQSAGSAQPPVIQRTGAAAARSKGADGHIAGRTYLGPRPCPGTVSMAICSVLAVPRSCCPYGAGFTPITPGSRSSPNPAAEQHPGVRHGRPTASAVIWVIIIPTSSIWAYSAIFGGLPFLTIRRPAGRYDGKVQTWAVR